MDNIPQQIERVRTGIRLGLATETAARIAIALAAFFWGWLLVDWMFEPPTTLRVAAYVLGGIALLLWLVRTSLSALFAPLPDHRIAALIERKNPELGDTLLTSLSADDTTDPVHRRLVEAAGERATAVLDNFDRSAVVDLSRQRPWAFTAAVGVAACVLFAFGFPLAASVYFQRLALADTPWPRRVVLTADKFAPDDQGRLTRRVPKDAPFELDVRAALTDGHTAPAEVRAVVRNQNGARSRRPLAAIGAPTTGDQAHQAYRMSMDRLRGDLVIRLRGGDGRLGPLYVRVVPRPAIIDVQVDITPPRYLQARRYTRTADSIDQAPEGATLRVRARSNKPLKRVAATFRQAEETTPLEVATSDDGMSITLNMTLAERGGVVELSLLDTDGIESETPFRLPLRVKQDAAPQVDFALRGVSRAVTPEAVIRAFTKVEDDHAIGAATLRMLVGERTLEFPIQQTGSSPAVTEDTPEIDLLSLRSDPAYSLQRLEPGQEFQLVVAAEDRYDLRPEGPHVSSSQTESFMVVSPEELVARLEQREVDLRNTFQQVYEEARGAELNAERLDARPEGMEDTAFDQRRRLSVARLADQLAKSTDETRSVAEGFQAIYDELSNNRIQNDDLKDRIQARIIRPLERVAESSLPSLLDEIKQTQQNLPPAGQGPTLQPDTQQRLSAAVAEMSLALKEMKAVETYNEVLALLRGIIQEQRDLSSKTEDAKKSSFRKLLLD